METWKEIKDYSNYLISDNGKVICKNSRNYKFNMVIKCGVSKKGYIKVGLTKNGKQKTFLVHRLVAQAFIPNSENKETINHIDGIKSNNNVNNLEWATSSENQKHAYRNKLKLPSKVQIAIITEFAKSMTGEKHPNSKKIINVKTGKIYSCVREASDDIGMEVTLLSKRLRGKVINYTNLEYF